MKKTVAVCDVDECKRENASQFSFFKDRRPDGAGSMENWYYQFDLCPMHQIALLIFLLEFFEKDHKNDLINVAKRMKIKMDEK